VKEWLRRAGALHADLAALADVRAPGWWVLAGAAAVEWSGRAGYVLSDAEPASDTFIGHACRAADDPVAQAIARAHAARQAIRELDGTLPQQPLAVAIERDAAGARTIPNPLRHAAFADGGRPFPYIAALEDRIEDERELARTLALRLRGEPAGFVTIPGFPFVCVTLGEEPAATARHGHRRAWTDRGGPWLGCGQIDGMNVVSTCHLVVDGYGHAVLAARIAELTRELIARVPRSTDVPLVAPPPDVVDGAIPLQCTWGDIPSGMRALRIAYALGCVLHRRAGNATAAFSPTIQIPVAPGAADDPDRHRKRVIPAITSVRFSAGAPEPYAQFAARTKEMIAREAAGQGLTTRLHASLRAIPTPLVWKRRAIAAERPRWQDGFATVLGGRGCVSKIVLSTPSPAACAVSSPAKMATASDPLGGCVVTIVDDGRTAAITLCGSGTLAEPSVLDEALATLP
jgi:hypothetical protein